MRVLVLVAVFMGALTLSADLPIIVSEEATANEKLTIDSLHHDFGRFYANEQQLHSFKMTNKSSEDIKIIKLHSTCGCISDDFTMHVVKSGETVVLPIAITPNYLSGPFTKILYIETDNKEQRLIRITLSGIAVPFAKISPSNLTYMGVFRQGEKRTYEYKITPHVANAEIAVMADSIPEYVTADLEHKEDYWLLKVTIIPKENDNIRVVLKLVVKSPTNWPDIVFTLYGNMAK